MRLMKTKVRVKGILMSLLESSDAKIIPIPLIIFLGSLTKN